MIITIWWKPQQRKGENCWMKQKTEMKWEWPSQWKSKRICRARKCKCCLSVGIPIFNACGNAKHQICPNSFTNIWLIWLLWSSLCFGKGNLHFTAISMTMTKGNGESVDELQRFDKRFASGRCIIWLFVVFKKESLPTFHSGWKWKLRCFR